MDPSAEWWTTTDVAEYLGVGVEGVRRVAAARSQQGPGGYRRRDDGAYEYPADEVKRYAWELHRLGGEPLDAENVRGQTTTSGYFGGGSRSRDPWGILA